VLDTPTSDLGNGLSFLKGLEDCFVHGDFQATFGNTAVATGELTYCSFKTFEGRLLLYQIAARP